MFTSIANPYIVGNPIKTSEMFFGRQDDFDFIKRKLESGQKSYIIVLCGERRSGKTSILFQILGGRLGDSFIPVLIDMQAMAGLKNEREFFEKFANETLKCIDDKIDIKTFFKESDSSYKAFSGFLQEIHNRNPKKHILFLVDEYELIEAKISEGSLNENLIPYLAGLLEGDHNISFLFTGSTNLEDRDTNLWQILFAKSLFRNVSYLSRDDSLRLITEPVKDLLSYDLEVLNVIFRLTWGQPFYTQVVCQYVVDYVNTKQLSQILLEDLDVVIAEILENPFPQMIYFWNNLSDDKKLVLSLLSEILEKPAQRIEAEEIITVAKQRKFGLQLSVKSINMTLESLFHFQYVSKSPSGFNFQMDLFRRWIKRDHAIWRVMKEVSALGQASSVVDQVYKNEISDPGKKSFKWVMSVAVVLFAVVIGWWVLKPSTDTTSQKPTAQLDPKDKVPEQKIAKSQNKVLPHTEIKKESISSAAKKPIIKNTATNTKKKSLSTAIKTDPVNEKAEQVTDFKMRQEALSAKERMLDILKLVVEKQSGLTAPQIFASAKQAEESASTKFEQSDFENSKQYYDKAISLYNKTLIKKTEDSAKLKASATTEKEKLQKIRKDITKSMMKLNLYQVANQNDSTAISAFNQGNYEVAIRECKKATQDYFQLVSTYKLEKKNILTIISNYLNAIENESISQMKKNYSTFAPALEKEWQTLFNFANSLDIRPVYKRYDFDDHNARVQVDVNLDINGAGKPTQNHWKIDLQKSSESWTITNISEGK